jgi:peptidoglycan/LPS O-acetylase OafA/YrhL
VGKSIDGTAWSLSAEWAAYLVFPILAGFALFGCGSTAALLAMHSAAAAVLTVWFTRLDGEIHRTPLDAYDAATCEPLLRCLAGFLMGLFANRFVGSNQGLARRSGNVVSGLTLALLFACLGARIHDLLILPLFPLAVVTVYSNRGRVGRFLGGKYLNALGLVSYSICLVHPYFVDTKLVLVDAPQRFLSANASDLSGSIIVYTALLFISAITYRCVEVPGRRFIMQLSNAFITPRAPHRSSWGTRKPMVLIDLSGGRPILAGQYSYRNASLNTPRRTDQVYVLRQFASEYPYYLTNGPRRSEKRAL